MFLGAIGLYFFVDQGQKPEWLELDVFSFYSSFMITKSFAFIRNNQGDEISTLVFFVGSFLVMASAEKRESPFYQANRLKALARTSLVTMIVFIFEYLFLHGMAIVFAALILPYLIPFFYFAIFYLLNKTGGR